jgi:hypothetical protein
MKNLFKKLVKKLGTILPGLVNIVNKKKSYGILFSYRCRLFLIICEVIILTPKIVKRCLEIISIFFINKIHKAPSGFELAVSSMLIHDTNYCATALLKASGFKWYFLHR